MWLFILLIITTILNFPYFRFYNMRLYEQKKWWKRALAVIALCIGIFSIWYTTKLVKQLSIEEEKKIKLWANATQSMAKAEGNIDFMLDNRNCPTLHLTFTSNKKI
jgi:hypothetical protein